MEDLYSTPINKWTEFMVSTWLTSIGVKDDYIKTLREQEVDGKVLLTVTEEFLKKETAMKAGPAHYIIDSRNKFIKNVQKQQKKAHKRTVENPAQGASVTQDLPKSSTSQETDQEKQDSIMRKRDSKPRPYGKLGTDHPYVKHDVLQPETGVIELITPCHEYKSLKKAAKLDRCRLQSKLGYELLKFATGCMNIRSNGTIHFGVMDSKGDSGYAHGEIIGIPIKEKDVYTDALGYIEKCFKSDHEVVRQCIRPPEFIQVIDSNCKEQHYVVEFDVNPSVSIVRNKVFPVSLPKFSEESNKIIYEEQKIYHRVGANTAPVDDINRFYQGVVNRDAQREAAEKSHRFTSPELCQDLERKLMMLMTSGKKQIEKEKWYILVTNKFSEEDLQHIEFLENMKLFCVFDFDPDSMVSGLCHEYVKHHAVSLHFMQNYKIPSNKSIREFESHLHLFDQTSWIFCNGRNDFGGNETPCDESTWFKTRKSFLKDCVSLICKEILPKGTFLVIFLLTSPVETPLLNTFDDFFFDMHGHEDIICISESEGNFQKWQASVLRFCDKETVNSSSVVGLKMSHVNATLLQIQGPSTRHKKLLPVSVKAKCHLLTRDEETMCSLEIVGVNQCEDMNREDIESKKEEIERDFYRGGNVKWKNFWLAEKGYIGEMIQRDGYHEVTSLLRDTLKWSSDQMPVKCINIYHHPGSGGSTVGRHVLWNQRKDLRCAVVNPSKPVGTVSEHAVMLREYDEKDPQKCLPVLLLVEDCDKYLEDLKNELETAINTKKIANRIPCFVLLCCKRSHDPEKMSKESPLLSVSVTHKLSKDEKRQFERKLQALNEVKPEFILTFVLMSKEFEPEYVKKFVQNLLQGIDEKSAVTQLIRYVALLNTYVENSFITQSHCEALLHLRLSICGERFQQHAFENCLSEQAKLVFIHLRDERTQINSIRIIHQLVAKEILHQLLKDKLQSELALELLSNDVLFNHTFGGEEYRKFLRELFIRRYKISSGDKTDSYFSPLIEHVRQNEYVSQKEYVRQKKPENAIKLLLEAYKWFDKDAYIAQQLARLFYWYEKFNDAKQWAETAANIMPNNSYILDTKGQVYRRWFTTKCKALEQCQKTPVFTVDAIETALKAIECFQTCQKVAVEETDTMNNSGFFGVVEVGCRLLELISSHDVFSGNHEDHSELQKYLLTEHIPKEIEEPWKDFHHKLKNLQPTIHKALEWISEELSYFQTYLNTDEEETSMTSELTIRRPKRWLVNKSSVYANFFCKNLHSNWQSNLDNITEFNKHMYIYKLGGGNFTTIFSILDQKNDDQKIRTLENIISLYPKGVKILQAELINYIASHLALSAISPGSPKLAPFKDLQKFSRAFLADESKWPSHALFLCTLLNWPEYNDTDQEKENKYKIIRTAITYLQQTYSDKMKNILLRKRRIFTYFYLGKGHGYYKFVHKSKIGNFHSVSEKRLKCVEAEMFKMQVIKRQLKDVNGWTEDGRVYLQGPKVERFPIHPLNESSVPAGNENVTFYVGFTFRGPVACNITRKSNC